MTMCPYCDKVFDESEYAGCPYCSGEIEDEKEKYYKQCPNCDGNMYWYDELKKWSCSNCGEEFNGSKDDYDGILE